MGAAESGELKRGKDMLVARGTQGRAQVPLRSRVQNRPDDVRREVREDAPADAPPSNDHERKRLISGGVCAEAEGSGGGM